MSKQTLVMFFCGILSLSACGGGSGSSGLDEECADAVRNRAAQGEYGSQDDAITRKNIREAYNDCAF